MPVFDKIEFVPKAVSLKQGINGFIDPETSNAINQPLYSSTTPALEDDGVYPILPFDLPFKFFKSTNSPGVQYPLFTYPINSTKIIPYTALELRYTIQSQGLILEGPTFDFTRSSLFETHVLFNPTFLPSDFNIEYDNHNTIKKTGVIEVNTSIPPIVLDNTTTVGSLTFNIQLYAIDEYGIQEGWAIRGLARFI